jgi:IclR family transcriptional regulator, acetate operon repressor
MSKQIQSIERALYILESTAFDRGSPSGTELAGRLGVHKSTVSHLTSTLQQQGYLARSAGSNRVRMGPKLYRLGRATGIDGSSIMKMPPVLSDLADASGETAHVAELRGRFVFYLANEYPERALRVQTETGAVEPAHSTAVGKALLAGLEDEDVRSLFRGVELEPLTHATVTDVERLCVALEEVRRRGYAVDRGEQTAGTGCIAAPVRDSNSFVVAAVGISGPEERVMADESELAKAVLEAGSRLEETIGEG